MKKKRRGSAAVILVGVCLLIYGLLGVWNAPNVLQYVVDAPLVGSAAENDTTYAAQMEQLITLKEQVTGEMADVLECSAVYGVIAGQPVSAEKQAQATLYAVEKGFFQVLPAYLTQGRLVQDAECTGVQNVCVIDEKLSFELFRGSQAIGQKVTVGGAEYEVIGITRHSRPMGQTDEYTVYIPLRAAVTEGLQLQTLNISAAPVARSGGGIMFKADIQSRWKSGGMFYDLDKEAMRKTVLPRIALLLLGIYAIIRLYGLMNRCSGKVFALLKRDMSQRYFINILPKAIGLVLLVGAGYAAVTGVLYLLMDFSVQPLYTFTEWVPECIVEWKSIESVFRGLVNEASALKIISTIEMETLNYYGGFVRWGMLTALLGLLIFGVSKRNNA